MKNKFTLKGFLNDKKEEVDVDFELQKMDNMMFFDVKDLHVRGIIKFTEYMIPLLRDCVVKPADARKVDYFKNDLDALNMVGGVIMGLQKNPTKKKATIEFSN